MGRFLYANEAPGAHPRSWYAATAGPAPARPALEGDLSVDAVVIGGGFAGLSAALGLAEAGRSVALVEAHRIGWGASGRNGGQLASLPRRDVSFFERAMGREDARRVLEISADANAYVRDLAARAKIDCDLRDGVLEVHHRARFDRGAEAEVERMALHYGVDWLRFTPPEERAEILPARGYFGGVLDTRAAHLHPLKLALGMARAAEAAGATLHERTRALRLEVSPPRVHTEGGVISAREMVVAANGYHDGLAPALSARVMPINNFIVATEPLGARAQDVLRRDVAVADSRFVVNYFRLSPDRRLLFGGGESLAARFPQDIAALVRPRMLRLFPQLQDARIDYAWGGVLGITMTRAPLFARLGPRALAIGGWSGSGVHMASLGGRIAAQALAGEQTRFDLLSRAPTPAFPGGARFRDPLLALAVTWYRLRDWV